MAAMWRLFSAVLAAAVLLAACSAEDSAITIHYHLVNLAPADIIRVDTLVAPTAGLHFYADQPYRVVATGVGYEVRDLDGTGTRTMLITFDSTLGYKFASSFSFRLLPPVDGTPPALSLFARAMGTSDAISAPVTVDASFASAAARNVDIDLTDARCAGAESCPADQTCCPGVGCTRLVNDVGNCGSCGHACGGSGDSCSGGACRCAGGSACSGADHCCAGLGCIDLQSDRFHCGTCDHACNPGEDCVNGSCSCGGGAACSGATAICCQSGGSFTCTSGTCPCGGASCSYPDVCCSDQCVDVRNDNGHCGGCATTCATPLSCSAGACACKGTVCAKGDTCCDSGCANLGDDPAHCGSCTTRCGDNETCGTVKGVIGCLCNGAPCPARSSCCGTSCVDSRSNFANCGACGHSCKQGEVCVAGACTCNGGPGCVGNQVCCGTSGSGSGGCFDVSTGPDHCGSCEAGPCQQGQECVMGRCVASTDGCKPQCQDGNQCVNGTCVCKGNQADGGAACSGGLTCCGDSGCVDLRSDPKHCNSCGNACKPDPLCCDGACMPNNTDHCGACDVKCDTKSCCPPCLISGGYQCKDFCGICL
jgi:hypothetical protein